MKKKDIAARLAATTDLTPFQAADELDTAIYTVLKNMRKHGPSRPTALQRLIQQGEMPPDPKGRRATS